jgi:hypothetical protein
VTETCARPRGFAAGVAGADYNNVIPALHGKKLLMFRVLRLWRIQLDRDGLLRLVQLV